MKTVSGAVLLLAAEQSFAHAKLVVYPNEDAGAVLIPASLVFLVLGGLLMAWGLVAESKNCPTTP